MRYVKWLIRMPVMLVFLPFGVLLGLVDILIWSIPDDDENDKFIFYFSEGYWKAWKP